MRIISELTNRTGLLFIFFTGVLGLAACAGNKTVPEEQSAAPAEPETLAAEPESAESIPLPEETGAVAPVRVAIREDAPDKYTVKPGDTLWDIASVFLKDPWLWPEIWYFNSQIPNPHLIYPGDVLTLIYFDGRIENVDGRPVYVDGVPKLQLSSDSIAQRLSPQVRIEPLSNAIPTIPLNDIQPFLTQALVVDQKVLDAAPYIVGNEDKRLVAAQENLVYVRDLANDDHYRYNIFRPGRTLHDPDTREVLGVEAIMVSEGQLIQYGDPATFRLIKSYQETMSGDRILPIQEGEINYNFVPKSPKQEVAGKIIALNNAVSHTGRNQIVIVNLGKTQNIEVGTVLGINQAGEMIKDRYAGGEVKLPDQEIGLLLIFRVFDRVSYGLIVRSSRPVQLFDVIKNPIATSALPAAVE